jgi:hypothetical protein
MAKYFAGQKTLTLGDEVLLEIRATLASAGWTNVSGTLYQYSSGGRTSQVDVPNIDWRGTVGYIYINGVTCYFPVSLLTAGSVVNISISADIDFFYFRIQGPDPGAVGAQDAVLGSARAFAMLTTIKPADSFDTNLDALQVAIRSHSGTSPIASTASVLQKYGPTGIANQAAELACSRPAIQDVANVGDLPPSIRSGSGYFGSRYAVIDSTYGIRGTLNNVAFGSENYVLAGDNASQQFTLGFEYIRAGVRYYVDAPCGSPSASSAVSYSPLGLAVAISTNQSQYNSNPILCGPRVFIKKGDGA